MYDTAKMCQRQLRPKGALPGESGARRLTRRFGWLHGAVPNLPLLLVATLLVGGWTHVAVPRAVGQAVVSQPGLATGASTPTGGIATVSPSFGTAKSGVTTAPPRTPSSISYPYPLANPTDGGRFNGKIERYAGRLMAKYDLNGDLLLEQSEWIAMHGDPAGTMDLDGDGVITIDEIVNRVSDYGRRSLRVVPNVPLHFADASQDTTNIDAASRTTYRVHPDDSQANDSANGQPNSPEVRMMRRFFVIPSQLPQGIAGWFLDNDADGDGQVTMAEFSANWTEVEAAQFASYDLNGDGVITAAECVRAETARAEREAAEARGAASAPTNDESGAVAADSAG
ncbi:MAG: hypothetical protein KDA63_15715 [Planctomycetales bacterium]|nr:hypothetical protein [Planctomycetales bacterium]